MVSCCRYAYIIILPSIWYLNKFFGSFVRRSYTSKSFSPRLLRVYYSVLQYSICRWTHLSQFYIILRFFYSIGIQEYFPGYNISKSLLMAFIIFFTKRCNSSSSSEVWSIVSGILLWYIFFSILVSVFFFSFLSANTSFLVPTNKQQQHSSSSYCVVNIYHVEYKEACDPIHSRPIEPRQYPEFAAWGRYYIDTEIARFATTWPTFQL